MSMSYDLLEYKFMRNYLWRNYLYILSNKYKHFVRIKNIEKNLSKQPYIRKNTE